ncbi:MAG: ribonuclease PH [Armatimonadota bacterium]
MRIDGRAAADLRPCKLVLNAQKYPEGSCLIQMGNTRVLCAASVEERVPRWMVGKGEGWVTAEYAMLPRSTQERTPRETGRPASRSMEIQRLIGRSLRAVTDLAALGERRVVVDCDVLQADGGTRTAAITGACVALAEAVHRLQEDGIIKRNPLRDLVAAVSVGIVGGENLLDLNYEEDSRASVDLNLVMCGRGDVVEVQGTAEGAPFTRRQLDALIDLGQQGIEQLVGAQREALGEKLKV